MVAKSSAKMTDLVKRRLFHARAYWNNDNQRYGILLAENLLLNHYRIDNELTKDRRRIKPKTQRQFNLARHKASLLLRQMPDFDTHAVQPGADQAAAEVSKRIIDNIFLDPLKGYHDVRSRMVWSMLAAERGCVAIDWDSKWGVCFRFVDPRRLHITPGFTYLHDPRNPLVLEEIPMRLSAVRAMKAVGWDVPDDLTGDGGMTEYNPTGGGNREADGVERDQGGHLPSADPNESSDPIVTICKAWWRDDPFGPDNKKLANADLPESEWHHVDDATGTRVPFDPMNPQPPMGTNGPMRFVTSKAEMNTGHEYDDGYLCITAPWYWGEEPLFEGKWTEGAINPSATLSAFPYMELTSYKHPLRRAGISDTELTHSNVIIDNVSRRNAWEQMNATGGILITRPGGLKDADGNQYKITNEPINIAYADDMLTQEAVKFFQAPGMNPATMQFRQLVEQEWQNIGTGDFSASLGPERSKDIAVGTANLLQQTGDLPTQLHQQDLNLQECIGARVALDLCRAYMGDQVISWVTDSGEVAYANVRGEDLVPLNVTVLEGKEWRQQDTDRVQATAQLVGMLGKSGLPPEVVPAMLRDAGIANSVVQAIGDALQKRSQDPPTPPDPNALITALASLIKSGGPVAVNQVEAALQMAQLPPPQGAAAQAPPPPGNGRPPLSVIQGGSQNG